MKKKTKKAKVFLIEKYYETLEINGKLRWDADRVWRMCQATHVELDEIRAILRLSARAFETKVMSGKTIDKQLSLLLMQIAVSKGYISPNSPKQ